MEGEAFPYVSAWKQPMGPGRHFRKASATELTICFPEPQLPRSCFGAKGSAQTHCLSVCGSLSANCAKLHQAK